MADHQAVATPASTTDSLSNVASKTPAPKDRSCPFCAQPFTSSSLGRHLDLYIKPKSPKPADGVHNVDEIRKMRKGITRRQARGSGAKREGSTPMSASERISLSGEYRDYEESPGGSIAQSPGINGIPGEPVGTRFNVANWQATGVINNLPPRQASGMTPLSMRREASMGRHQQVKVEHEARQRALEDRETSRAAELALQEVLGSVKAASARAYHPSPFGFDFLTMDFPGLCLKALPAPSTLFSQTPFSSDESWSIHPPGQKQFEALNRLVRERLQAWQREHQHRHRQPHQPNHHHDYTNDGDAPPYEAESQKVLQHLQNAYMHWKPLPDKEKHNAWQLEILRTYAKCQEQKANTDATLERAQQEIEHLKAQNDQLSRCQLPREYLLHPPNTLPLHEKTARELSSAGKEEDWDYDRLIEKWKTVIRQTRRSGSGIEAQRPLATTPSLQQQRSSSGGIDSNARPPRRTTPYTGNNTNGNNGGPSMLKSTSGSISSLSGPTPQTQYSIDMDEDPPAPALQDAEDDDDGDDDDADADADADAEEAPELEAAARPPSHGPPRQQRQDALRAHLARAACLKKAPLQRSNVNGRLAQQALMEQRILQLQQKRGGGNGGLGVVAGAAAAVAGGGGGGGGGGMDIDGVDSAVRGGDGWD